MLSRLRKRYGTATVCLFTVVLAFELAMIIHSLWRPLWFDESWRPDFIDRNFDIPLKYRESYAPISLGIYLITKALVLIADNIFVQRFTTYVALLVLPFVIYKFCETFMNKRTAQVAIVVAVLSGYVMEFSTQNKPYILDVVVTLLLPLVYKAYIDGKLKLWVIIAVSIAAVLLSFASFFILACLAGYLAYDYYRNRAHKPLKPLIIWAAVLGPLSLVYLIFFIKPQLTPALYDYYGDLYLHGSPLHILSLTIRNVLSVFNIATPRTFHGVGELMYVFWTYVQIRVGGKPLIHTDLIFGLIYAMFFCYGLWLLCRHKKFMAPYLLVALFVLEWFTSILHQWPFGNSRTNLFSLMIVQIVCVYGFVELCRLAMKRHRMTTAIVVAIFVGLIFPYEYVGRALAGQSTFTTGAAPSTGLQAASVYVASHSKPTDNIVVSYYVGPFGFDYFYNYSDYTKAYKARESHRVYYTYFHGRPKDPAIYSSKTMWLVSHNIGYKSEVPYMLPHGYRISRLTYLGDLVVVKLVRTDQ